MEAFSGRMQVGRQRVSSESRPLYRAPARVLWARGAGSADDAGGGLAGMRAPVLGSGVGRQIGGNTTHSLGRGRWRSRGT